VGGGGFGGGTTTPPTVYPAGGSDMGGDLDMGGGYPTTVGGGGYPTTGGGYPTTNGGGFGGDPYQPPTLGTGPITRNTWNIGGDTSTSITKGNEYAQKKKTEPTYTKKTPSSKKIIGDPKVAMQQLSAMQQNPYMRRA
jgi:hypothetical protein